MSTKRTDFRLLDIDKHIGVGEGSSRSLSILPAVIRRDRVFEGRARNDVVVKFTPLKNGCKPAEALINFWKQLQSIILSVSHTYWKTYAGIRAVKLCVDEHNVVTTMKVARMH